MNLKQITFVFENCDSIKIEGTYIGDFLVDDIKTSIRRTSINAIHRMDTANTVVIEILKEANKECSDFDQYDVDNSRQMTFDRFMKYGDITGIQFELEENPIGTEQSPCTKYYYYVNWTGDSKYTNDAQKTCVSPCGNLYIVIADGKEIEDFFNSFP